MSQKRPLEKSTPAYLINSQKTMNECEFYAFNMLVRILPYFYSPQGAATAVASIKLFLKSFLHNWHKRHVLISEQKNFSPLNSHSNLWFDNNFCHITTKFYENEPIYMHNTSYVFFKGPFKTFYTF